MSLVAINHAASAMRTALVGHPMVMFQSPVLVGPEPQPGRMVEVVETVGKHLHVMWDDGLVLDTQVGRRTEWHVYRKNHPWRRSWEAMHALVETDDFVAVCFDSADLETYRQPDPTRHPGHGRLGPHLTQRGIDLRMVFDAIMNYPDPEARVRDVLIDPRVMRGVGNVYRCEVLWATELSPWAHIGELSVDDGVLLVNTVVEMVRANMGRERRSTTSHTTQGLAVYGRRGQSCIRCHDPIESIAIGRYGRRLYWCPGCQVRLDRRQPIELRSMDPHPAATKYLNDLRRARAR